MKIENMNIGEILKENNPDELYAHSHSGTLVFNDNYLNEITGVRDELERVNTNGKRFYNERLMNLNSTNSHPKLMEQLMGKNRHKSYLYNILLFVCFNINVSHFCFPYITLKCGIFFAYIILIVCGIYSYMIQASLVSYILNNRGTNACNYANIIEHNFGNFSAGFLETLVMIWYGIQVLVCLRTSKII